MSAVMPSRPWSRGPGIGALRALLSFLLLAFLAAQPAAAAEGDPAGRATITLGTVEAIAADGTVRQLGRQDPVFEGDTLRTGPRGRAQIRFTDQGLMSLRPDTELAIDDYEFDAAAPATGRQELSVTRGGFRTATGGIASANRDAYRVRTPVAVIGVRGTIFELFQQPGGPLTLGVSRGGITALTSTGNEATLGAGSGFNYARVRSDGSVAYLLAPPSELDASPDLDEGGEGGEGGGGEEGADLGGTEESSVATGGGDAGSAVGAVSESGGGVLATTVDPESTGVVSDSNTGSGDLPTEQPVPLDGVLSTADRDALIASGQFAVVAGVSSAAVDANGVPVIDGYGVGSALGALDADGAPLFAGLLDSPSDFPPGVETTDRATLLSQTDAFLTASSGRVVGPRQPADGAAGVTWGRFTQPTRLFLDASDPTQFIETSGLPEIPFLIGTPTDIADLTGQRFFELVDADVATGPDYVFLEMFSDALLDLGTGELDGILDLALAESATPETMRFIYVVDYNAQVRGGLLQDTNITLATLFDQSTGEERVANAELSGFLSGTDAEYLNLGFAYSTPDDPGLDTAGLALLQSGLTPPNALTAEELIAIDQGFAFVVAECCFESDTAEGLISDPRPSNGLDAVAALNRATDQTPLSPLDPAFLTFPPNTVVRRQDAGVANFATLDLGAGGELATFEWQSVDGGQVGLFDSTTGDPVGEVTGNLLVLAGRMAELADLTGTGRFELADLSRGLFTSQSGTVASQPLAGGEIGFNVDFASGGVFGGVAHLYTDAEDDAVPSFARDGFQALFEGQVALANDNPFVEFVITGGRYADSDEDAGGNGLLNLTDSDLSGFFAGDGSVFNMSLNLQSGPLDPNTPHDPINAVALAVLQQQDLSLSAAELTQLEQGRVFAAAACCFLDTAGTAIGPAGDPGNLGGDVLATEGEFVLGINIGGTGEDLGPLEAGVLAASPEQLLRKGGAFGVVFPDFPAPPETELVVGSWRGFGGNRALAVEADTGAILEELGSFIAFTTGFPSDIATLQAAGFTTFGGSTDVFVNGIRTLGTESFNNVAFELDPSRPGTTTGGAFSFNVNLANGELTNGHLFALTDFPEERGGEAFFRGQIAYANGNPFVDVELIDGVFNQNTPLDLEASSIELFFAGDGPQNGSAFVAQGSFALVSEETSAFENPGRAVMAGTLSVGNSLLPETRLTAADALALENPDPGRIRLGLAAFSRLNSFGLPIGAEGLLLGRAADADPTGGDFFLGANALYVQDDGTGTPIETNTSRRGFFAQPFDFVLRKDTAFDQTGLFQTNVIPGGGADFSADGFVVSWGAWDAPGSGSGPRIQDAAGDANLGVTLDSDVLFASVTPTPQSQMPGTGVFNYGGALGGLPDAQVLATGGGDLSGHFTPVQLSQFSVGFEVDFANGAISNGALTASYPDSFDSLPVDWSVGFDGFVNGAIADLAVNSIEVRVNGTLEAGPTFLFPFDAGMSGIFTGPAGERFAGGFSINAEQPGGDFLQESIQGLYVIDRQQLGGPQ
jgi:hypothetical protein